MRTRAAPGSRLPGQADLTGQVGALPEVAFGVRRVWPPSVHASAVPRFISATARRSLPSAMSSSDGPATGEARNLACSMTPATSPRRRASDSCSDATATPRRRWRSGGAVSACASATARCARRLVQAALGEVTHRAHQGQLGVIRARREGPQQRPHGLRLPVQGQAERMIGEQPGRAGPVARRLGVPDGLSHLALPDKPLLQRPAGAAPVPGRAASGAAPAAGNPRTGGGSGTRSARGPAIRRTRSRPRD